MNSVFEESVVAIVNKDKRCRNSKNNGWMQENKKSNYFNDESVRRTKIFFFSTVIVCNESIALHDPINSWVKVWIEPIVIVTKEMWIITWVYVGSKITGLSKSMMGSRGL